MRSRLRVTLRSSDWRKLSTLLSSPVVAVELPREREEAERAGALRREAPPDLAPLRERAELFDLELRLAVVLFALDDLALEDFARVLFALPLFALPLFALLRELALLLDDPLRAVLFEPLLAPDFFVAIRSSSVVPRLARGTISLRGFESGLYGGMVRESQCAAVLWDLAAPPGPCRG